MSLEGKVVLVTGTSSGLGYALARVFARQGAKVVAAARRRERGEALVRELREAGGECVFVPTDVAIVDDCRRAVEAAINAFGRLDLLVNNTGTGSMPPVIPSHEVAEAQWDAVVPRAFDIPLLIGRESENAVNPSYPLQSGPSKRAA